MLLPLSSSSSSSIIFFFRDEEVGWMDDRTDDGTDGWKGPDRVHSSKTDRQTPHLLLYIRFCEFHFTWNIFLLEKKNQQILSIFGQKYWQSFVKMCFSSVDWINVALLCVEKIIKISISQNWKKKKKKNPDPKMPKAKQLLTIFDKHSHLRICRY